MLRLFWGFSIGSGVKADYNSWSSRGRGEECQWHFARPETEFKLAIHNLALSFIISVWRHTTK